MERIEDKQGFHEIEKIDWSNIRIDDTSRYARVTTQRDFAREKFCRAAINNNKRQRRR